MRRSGSPLRQPGRAEVGKVEFQEKGCGVYICLDQVGHIGCGIDMKPDPPCLRSTAGSFAQLTCVK